MSYLKLALAVITAIPKIKQMFDDLVDMYNEAQVKKIENKVVTKRHKRSILMSKIKEAKNDEERRILSIMLSDLNK